MDTNVLRKKLTTFKSSEGQLRKISDEVIIEVLRAWENWPGTSAELYRELDLSRMQMATIIKKAKKMVKNGLVPESDFKEVAVEEVPAAPPSSSPCGIELVWKNNVIRFQNSELLWDFLERAETKRAA